MNLRSVDLNLLVALDALLAERHVTRAAVRLGLSQPATSNALARLRVLFQDELLVRTPAGMEPTLRALELAEATRQLLRQVERVMQSEASFDPARCERTFVLRMSDLLGHLLLPRIMVAFRKAAPHAAIDIVHLPPARTVEALEADECDLAVSMGLAHGTSIETEPLLVDRMVCLMRRGHPAADKELTLESFLALGHLRVSISPTDSRFVDDVLAKAHRRRRIALNLPHWLVVPEVVRRTDLVAVMPERLGKVFATGPSRVVLRDLPFASAPFDWSLYWHRRHEGSRAHVWLRRLVGDAVRATDAGQRAA